MRNGSESGRLVALVGIDGAGKTSQVKDLASWLQERGIHTNCLLNQTLLPVRRALDVIAREEGHANHLDLVGADTIRLISTCSKLVTLGPLDNLLGETGSVSLVDRYTYCQYAAARLQGARNEDFLRRLNRGLPTPDVTIFLDVAPEVARERIDRRGIDRETLQFLIDYRRAYQSLPEFDSFVIVDSNGDRASVQRRVRAAAAPVIGLAYESAVGGGHDHPSRV